MKDASVNKACCTCVRMHRDLKYTHMVRSVARLLATLLRGEKSMLSKSNAVPRRPLTALVAGIVIASALASAPSLAADNASVVAAAQKSVEKFTAGTETKP